MECWDPIRVADTPEAADEYDGYICKFYALIIGSRDKGELVRYLAFIETDQMGLSPVPESRYEKVADALLSIPLT